jgi:hypothetical protein
MAIWPAGTPAWTSTKTTRLAWLMGSGAIVAAQGIAVADDERVHWHSSSSSVPSGVSRRT